MGFVIYFVKIMFVVSSSYNYERDDRTSVVGGVKLVGWKTWCIWFRRIKGVDKPDYPIGCSILLIT